jgi:hypothetical protein
VAWSRGGWTAVVVVVGILFVISIACSLALRRTPSLLGRPAPEVTAGH